MTDEEIQEIFFQECEDALAQTEEGLLACQSGTAEDDTINCIFRAVHSIKGGAGAFDFTGLQAFAHKFETVLSLVRDGELELTNDLIALLLRAFDMIADHIAAARGQSPSPDDNLLGSELEKIAEQSVINISKDSDEEPLGSDPAGTENPCQEEKSAPICDDIIGLDFDLDSLMDDLDAGDVKLENDGIPSGWLVEIYPLDNALKDGGEPLLILRELSKLGGVCVAADIESLPNLENFDADKSYIGWSFRLPEGVSKSEIEDEFAFMADDYRLTIRSWENSGEQSEQIVNWPAYTDSSPATAAIKEATESTESTASSTIGPPDPQSPKAEREKETQVIQSAIKTVRVDLCKLDNLIDAAGELMIAHAMLAQRITNNIPVSGDELEALESLTREIQDGTMAIRAQPIGSVFNRVPRIIRELEAETGKSIKLTMDGESTELDTTVVERLGEPLTHLVRNAVDHGIEDRETRIANGKPAEGKLHLTASQQSGRIVVSLSDDGAGINRKAVLKKAIERGLVLPDTQLRNEEIDNLILSPGFSTVDTVSNLSGRGVGMDVVSENVKNLGGRVSIESQDGEGCTFTLTLPLTLAIADGMIVTLGDQKFVIPLTHVLESLQPSATACEDVGNGLTVLKNRGQYIPIICLEQAINGMQIPDARKQASDSVLIVVESDRFGQAALMVDDILDQRQFVIKNLETNFQAVSCVAGATILGDGKVALILDVDAIMLNTVPNRKHMRAVA
tara:strand:- start:824 stop:3034 length:2211 start_codon:yes stop_codon:yes gene_type:complete